ncbi:adenylyl-sulfate kinase [Streptomyces sp. NBC_00859]|uniref:adenylyl-sulfate kinase n=1 Tax=Streptomyces sp. NBC_00859 TaxID=2903682 RepID=UPI00386EF0FE|nr:adenylyl-sulfate kinase [Streptomyces sp. NBC_00859]
MTAYEVLLIGGRSGVGKSTVGHEVSELLRQDGVAHCVLEGDALGGAHPAPPGDPHRSAITERNLAAVWANFAALGHSRLICTNTVSVLESAMFRRAMGGESLRVVRVLLTAGDATARARLERRESGSLLGVHIERSAAGARLLAARTPPGTVRVATDGRTVADVARTVRDATGW